VVSDSSILSDPIRKIQHRFLASFRPGTTISPDRIFGQDLIFSNAAFLRYFYPRDEKLGAALNSQLTSLKRSFLHGSQQCRTGIESRPFRHDMCLTDEEFEKFFIVDVT
jgi:hypothetical protein